MMGDGPAEAAQTSLKLILPRLREYHFITFPISHCVLSIHPNIWPPFSQTYHLSRAHCPHCARSIRKCRVFAWGV